jgi:hypothetical protein
MHRQNRPIQCKINTSKAEGNMNDMAPNYLQKTELVKMKRATDSYGPNVRYNK